jgi:Tfp pilus assembly protein PilX
MRLKRRIRDEGGTVLVTALILMIVAFGLGYAALAATDVQTHQTGYETAGEAAFNLAESALDAQARLVQLNWPGTTASTTTCNQSSTPSSTCPGTAVTNSFSSTYAGHEYSNQTWSTEVGGVCPTNQTCTSQAESPSYYSDPVPATAMGCDCYGANAVWLRSQATVLGQTRVVVGEIQRQGVVVPLPETTITAGGVNTSNNGNKVIIEQSDTAPGGLTGTIDLTCNTTQVVWQGGCAGWDAGKNTDQSSPGTYTAGYTAPNGYSVLSHAQLASLEQSATTYASCPTSLPNFSPSMLNGLVYIQNAGSNCVLPNNTSYNGCNSPPPSSATPGMIIVGSGSLEVGANVCYFGVIYMANVGAPTPQNGGACTSTNSVLTLDANSVVYGGLFADNCGLITIGQSSGQSATVYFDSLAFAGAKAYDTPVVAKNTFEILPNPAGAP